MQGESQVTECRANPTVLGVPFGPVSLPCNVPRFYFEIGATEPCPIAFGGDAGVLVYFLSLAFSTRYGAQHDLSRLALLLRGEYKIDLGPLTTFADRNVEEEADARELERVWQDAAPLVETLRRVIAVLESGVERVDALIAVTPDLTARLRDLLRMAEWAEARGARVRMSFEL
jgi:hypothetical protein